MKGACQPPFAYSIIRISFSSYHSNLSSFLRRELISHQITTTHHNNMRFSATALALTNSALLFQPVASSRRRRHLRSDTEQVGSIVNAGTAWVGQLSTTSDHHQQSKHRVKTKHTSDQRYRARTRLANPTVDLHTKRNECDPHTDAAADVGVLSCGHEFFCAESSESSLGGYCVDVRESSHGPVGRRRMNQPTIAFLCNNSRAICNKTLPLMSCGTTFVEREPVPMIKDALARMWMDCS